MENSFFEFRPSTGRASGACTSDDSEDAIDDSMRADESFSLLRSVPASARKTPRTVIAESDDDVSDNSTTPVYLSKHKFSLGPVDSADSSLIGRKRNKRGVALPDSDSDTDDMTPDEDMVMSAATRMSILGFKQKDMLTDESDFIESDDPTSRMSSCRSSLSDLPSVDLTRRSDDRISLLDSPPRANEKSTRGSSISANNSTGSPTQTKSRYKSDGAEQQTEPCRRKSIDIDYERPDVNKEEVFDVTMVDNQPEAIELTSDEEDCRENNMKSSASSLSDLPNVDLTHYVDDSRTSYSNASTVIKTEDSLKKSNDFGERKVLVALSPEANGKKNWQDSDDVKIVESPLEIVDLSSDDDVEMTSVQSPPAQKPPQEGIRQYLMPKSYPNAGTVYVPRHVKLNETNKLEGLREDLHKLKYLLENMDTAGLPDGGVRLRERLAKLEAEVRAQAEKVAAMIEEPAKPTAKDVAHDGFGAGPDGLSWDDLQAASNKVQPKMFGKQAMSTHIAERSHILERLRDLHESLASRPAESQHATQPRALRAKLMPHQTHALAWLRWRETQRPRGGILADDMGLGKTLTMISLVVAGKEGSLQDEDTDHWNTKENSKLVKGGTLVVCPASLLQQWASEVERHCATKFLSVCQHHGAARTTQPFKLAPYDMVFTTYNIVSRDLDKMGVLMRVRWSRVILDEAHIVRNHKAVTSRAVSALEGACRWCLTGTPVQNKELDIFALLKFLRCTPFDDILMWKKWIDNKSAGGQERLATVMRTLLLRRTKVQLQESGALTCLPERSTHSLAITLSKEEMNVYQKVLVFSKTLFAQFLHQRAEKQSDMSGGFLTRPEKDDAYNKMHKRMVALHGAKPVKSHEILVLLLRLRQLCCHAGLIAAMLDPDGADASEDPAGLDLLSELNKLSIEDEDGEKDGADDKEEEGTTVAEAIRSVLSPSNPVFNLKRTSSKIAAVLKCLQENVLKKTKEKAVVVSQWTSVLSLVERELRANNVACSTLSGAVPVPARASVVDKFNNPSSDVRVLLLSLCAGGVGLNLCGANHLLLLDPHWNPQLEEQAQDRIYRVGQTKPVHIYKFMCLETVEQSIKRLQEHKLELANNVLTGARHTNSSKLTIEDLKLLFNMNT